MSDINTQTLYDVKVQLFGVGTSSDRFEVIFLAGLRYVLNLIRSKVQGVSVTTPTNLATDITLDEDVFYAPVSSGLNSFINGHGAYTLDTKEDLRAIFMDDMRWAQQQFNRDTEDTEGRLGNLSD